MNGVFPEPQFDLVQSGVELCELRLVVEEGELRGSVHEVAEAHPDEADHHAPVIEPVEDAVDGLLNQMVEGGVRDALLPIVRVEVGIANLHRHAACQLALGAQVESEALNHPRQALPDRCHIDGILLEGALLTDRLSFLVGTHGGIILTVGLFPYHEARLAEGLLEGHGRQVSQGADGLHPHRAEQQAGLLPHHGNLAYRQRVEEVINIRYWHLKLPIRLGLARGNLGHCLVFREAERDGQSRLTDDALPQFVRPQPAVVETVHPRQVEVMLVNRHLLIHGCAVGDDLRHQT